MPRCFSIALAFAVLLAAAPSAGLAALCANEGGVHKACCCHDHGAAEAAGERCCCDLGSPSAPRGASFVPQESSTQQAPTWVALPVAAIDEASDRSASPASSAIDWLPPPGGPPVYLRVQHLLI